MENAAPDCRDGGWQQQTTERPQSRLPQALLVAYICVQGPLPSQQEGGVPSKCRVQAALDAKTFKLAMVTISTDSSYAILGPQGAACCGKLWGSRGYM